MSAGICGKRLGLEEIFGSPAPAPSAKRSRCSSYGSPVRSSDFGLVSDDKVNILLRMFPSMDREVVEIVLKTHDHKIDDAIKSLHSLCLGDDSTRTESAQLNSILQANENAVEAVSNSQTSKQKVEGTQNDSLVSESRIPQDVPSWVDIFVQEMMNASNWDDVRGRAMKILEAFERNVVAQTTTSVEEIASLKEQLQCLLRDNQILKRAVAIQYDRNMEHEKELKEVQQLKHVISQYQEQIRTLELNNYSLTVHLQRARESSSIPGQFHPDIF
uniref:Uncharacterized protein LOC105044443 isoform X2 n=1 Tax=Elaeis guineensis var. tenera TaxID=51953 RepID=A0A6I9R559_ELAGV|nr:uncharacterized protein LOC105044443 isoform X2 [Elaeis guineensis]